MHDTVNDVSYSVRTHADNTKKELADESVLVAFELQYDTGSTCMGSAAPLGRFRKFVTRKKNKRQVKLVV